MANKVEFNILIQGVEDFKKSTNAISKSLDDVSSVTKSVARDMSQMGSIVTALGASISGPLVLAFKNSAKASKEVSTEIKRMENIASDFQKELAKAVIPVFQKFNNAIENLFNAFKDIDPAFRAQILQIALMSGVMLTLSGILTIVVSKVISFVSAFTGILSTFLSFVALNPLIVAVGASILVVVLLMVKFKEVSDVVLSSFQVLFILLQNGFLTVKAALEAFVSASLSGISKIFNALSKVPGVMQEQFAAFAVLLDNQSALMKRLAFEDIQAVNDKARELGEILKTGEGTWSVGIDGLKTKFQEFLALFEGGTAGATTQGFVDGFNEGLTAIGNKLSDLKMQGAQFAQTLQNGMATAFSDIIMGAKSAGEAFKAFGQAMLKAIVDFIAQWLAFQVLSKALALIGVTFAVGQAAIVAAAWAPAAALASLATLGSNSVPAGAALTGTVGLANLLAVPKFATGSGGIKDDTMGLFNKGEIVVPNSFSDAIRSGDLSLSGGGSGGGSGVTVDLRGSTFNGITDALVEEIFTKASENIQNRTLAFGGA